MTQTDPATTLDTYEACEAYERARQRMMDATVANGPDVVRHASTAVGGLRPLARLAGLSAQYLSAVVLKTKRASPQSILAICAISGVHRRRVAVERTGEEHELVADRLEQKLGTMDAYYNLRLWAKTALEQDDVDTYERYTLAANAVSRWAETRVRPSATSESSGEPVF